VKMPRLLTTLAIAAVLSIDVAGAAAEEAGGQRPLPPEPDRPKSGRGNSTPDPGDWVH